MNYTTEEIKHFEKVSNFFNFHFYIDGEYPFYTDDRFLDDDLKVTKNVYKDGQRTTVNMLPTSLDERRGRRMFDSHSMQVHTMMSQKSVPNPFMQFTLQNWGDILTTKQKQFVVDSVNGKDARYTKQQRHQFRIQIQKRLKEGFLGGGKMFAYYKIGEVKTKLRLIEDFMDASDSNEQFASLIKKKIDKDYVNNIVYARMTPESRQSIVKYVLGITDSIPNFALYEFNEIMMFDLSKLEFIDLHM